MLKESLEGFDSAELKGLVAFYEQRNEEAGIQNEEWQVEPKTVEEEDLGIANARGVIAKGQEVCAPLAQRFVGISADDEEIGVVRDKMQYIPLHAEVLDAKVPLSLMVFKFVNRRVSPPRESVFFLLVRKEISGDDAVQLGREWREINRDTEEIGSLRFDITEEGFRLGDRQVNERFRGQGAASMILEMGERFIAAYGTEKGVKQKIYAEAGQLDVFRFLHKNGYLPDSVADADTFQRIRDREQGLYLGENLYVFSKEVPPSDRQSGNFQNSVRVKFSKDVEILPSDEISRIQESVNANLMHEIGKSTER